jgi:hypothetical protein
MQREVSVSYWKRYILVAVCAAFVALFSTVAVRVDAASVISVNTKANAKYVKKVKSLINSGNYKNIEYKFTDITGDGINEALILLSPKKSGSTVTFRIFDYNTETGKIKRILNYRGKYLKKLLVYKSNKTLILEYSGKNAKEYNYFTMKKGVYVLDAYKLRPASSILWQYYDKNNKRITETAFKNLINGVKYGKRSIIKTSTFTMANA